MTTTQASQHVLEEVARLYDLGSITSCLQVSSDPLTCAYKLKADRGSFCLKLHRQNKTAPRLDLEQKLIARLGEAGFALAPHLVQTRDGGSNINVQEERWSLYEFVDSAPAFDWKNPQWTASHCHSAGAALAEFHSFGHACLSLFEPGDSAEPLPPVHLLLPAYIKSGLEIARDLPGSVPLHPKLGPDSLLAGAKAVSREPGALAGSAGPYLIHGDYHPGNLLFDGDRAVCLIDYEEARLGTPSFDLGYAAVFFCMSWGDDLGVTAQGSSDGLLDEVSFQSFLEGYCRRARSLNLPSSLLDSLHSERAAFALLRSNMKLSIYLAIAWLLSRIACEKAQLRPLLSRALLHFARTLATLDES